MNIFSAAHHLNPFAKSAYDFEFIRMNGDALALSEYKGRPMLIVNIASLCTLTPQLEALEQLFRERQGQGLVVIGVPSNNFAFQEPKRNDEIVEFCGARFGVTFELVQKEHVIGLKSHPFYRWVFSCLGLFGVPTWNFHKILIKPNGKIAYSIPATITPESRFFKFALNRTITA